VKHSMKNDKDRLIELVNKKRTDADLSIRKLAEITGVSFATLSRLERGQGIPDDNTTVRLVNWLGDDAKQLDLPTAHVAEVHFRAAKNVDTQTIEALSAIASALKAKHLGKK
jgi:transcriptional regulator with XRE-family HTH domain